MQPWGWLLVALIILGLTCLFIWRYVGTQGFGTYSEPELTPCVTPSGHCNEMGVRTIIQRCQPNPATGRGCLGEGGQQTFQTLVRQEGCTLTCRSSIWQENSSGPCQVGSTALTGCIEAGTLGQRTVSKTCIAWDTVGANTCTAVEMVPVSGIGGETGVVPTVVIYHVGQTISEVVACTDYPNPVCGMWQTSAPVTPGATTIDQVNIGTCYLGSNYLSSVDCYTGGNPLYSAWREGYIVGPMSCVAGNTVTTPAPDGPTLNLCLPIDCSPALPNVSQLRNGTLPSSFTPVLCPGVTTDNPNCLMPCYLQPDNVHTGDPNLDVLANSLLFFSLGSRGFVGPWQTPSNNGQLIKMWDWEQSPGQTLSDTPLLLVPSDFGRTGCSPSSVLFNSGMIFTIGIRALLGGGQATVQIGTLIDNGFKGWLATNPDTIGRQFGVWRQARTAYQGPGVTSDQAPTFLLQVIGTIPGGLIISISRNGQPVYLQGLDGSLNTLSSVTVTSYPLGTDLCSRSLRSPGNCNLYHRTDDPFSLICPVTMG